MDLSNLQNFSRDQILSEELIRNIFAEEDEVIREKQIVDIQAHAKQIGCKTEFDRLLRAQRHQIAEARKELQEKQRAAVVSNTYQIADEAGNLSVFQTGRWSVTETGVTAQAYREVIIASRFPLIISKRLINKETGKSRLELTWWINRARKSITVDRSSAMSNNKIVALADYDFPATSETSKALVSYLSDFESLNISSIPTEISTSKFGWSDAEFVPYTDKIVFDGNTSFKSLVDSIVSAGDYEVWKNEVSRIRKTGRKEPLVYLAASFGSILLPLVNIAPFIVNLYGSTSKGKTVSLMMAASIWANPAGRGYIAESTSTANSLEIRQGILNHLPLMIDDLSKIRSKDKEKFVDLIYMLCAGGGKNRLNRNIEMRDTSTWDNIILTNIERPLTDETMQGGAINRVLDFEIEPGDIFGPGIGNEVVTVLSENYGFAGLEFVKCIQFLGCDSIPNLVKGYEKKIMEAAVKAGEKKEDKQVTPLAVLMLADEITEKMIFHDGVRLNMEYCLANIKSREQVSEMVRAYEHFLDVCSINRSKFDNGDFSDIWGTWRDEYIYIIPSILEKIAKEYNFSIKQFISWCKEQHLLLSDNDDRNMKKISLGGYNKRVRCYAIKTTYDGTNHSDGLLGEAEDECYIQGETDSEPEEPLPFSMP